MIGASALLLFGGCVPADRGQPSASGDQTCEVTDADLSGFALRNPSDQARAQETLSCLIAHADAVLEDTPTHYGEAHMRWHAYAVLEGQRSEHTLAAPARLLSRSEVAEAAAWIDLFFEVGNGARLDPYGCRRVPAGLSTAYEHAKPDTVSDLCDRLKRQQPDPGDVNALSELAPFHACPAADAPGHEAIKMLPARLAASIDGDEAAFACLLDHARPELDNGRAPIGEAMVVIAAGYLRGDVSEAEWQRLEAALRDIGPGEEALLEEALNEARTRYGVVLGEARD